MTEESAGDPLLTARDWNGGDQYAIDQADYDRVAAIIGAFLRGRTVEELMERAVRERILLAMTRPEARAVTLRMVAWADVVADSFRPGVLDRWGVGYDALREVNPRLIMVT